MSQTHVPRPVEREATPSAAFPGKFPRYPHEYADLETVVVNHVLPGFLPATPVISHASLVLSVGSCFAAHIAKNLQDRGLKVASLQLAETSTTPALILKVLERSIDERGDCIIITVGIGEGAFADMLATLRQVMAHALTIAPRVIFTVSPATLNRSTTPSGIVADCESKCLVRAAVAELLRDAPQNVHYWPSFEIVRWLGAHISRSVYGGTDGICRHVDQDIVDMIMGLFVRYWLIDEAKTPA